MKTTLAVLSLLTFAAVPSFAADKKGSMPEMDAAMKQMMEYGTPGAEHARLKPVAGSWTVKSKMWMKPGAKHQESTGSSHYAWILDGRYLKHDYKGDMGGMPFTGVGHHGYDKVKKAYTSTWMDSMSTGMAASTGQYDAKTRTITDKGSFACPMTGDKDRWFRSEWKLPDGAGGKTMTFAMWHKDPESGKEFKAMEMVYTRTK